MADNVNVNTSASSATGGDLVTMAAKEIAGVKYPRMIIVDPVTGIEYAYAPVDVRQDAQAWAPGYKRSDLGGGRGAIDQSGAQVTRATCLTDEGTFRCNFANSSLAVSLGSVTVAGAVVTGTFPDTLDLHPGEYFKLDADGEANWTQIESRDSLTKITLVSTYPGGSSGAASRACMKPVSGSGTIAVANGAATLTLSTAASDTCGLVRLVDYGPLVGRQRVTISQRIAGNDILIGYREEAATPRWFARFRANGTTNTSIICETGRNPTGAPSSFETQSTTVTLPNGATTAQATDYRVEVLTERVVFFINGQLVAEHVNVIPGQDDTMAAIVEGVNSSPVSSTVVTIDYVTGKNHDKLETGVFSDNEKITAQLPPDMSFAYNQAGVIAINTDLLILDMSVYRAASIQCVSMGTTGVVTVYATNDLTQLGTAISLLPIAGGAKAASFNAAGMWIAGKAGRFLRLRLTTATTAGTTTLAVITTSSMPPIQLEVIQGTGSSCNAQITGAAAQGATASGNPVFTGGVAKTAQPTARTDGQIVAPLYSKVGQAVTIANHVRDLRILQPMVTLTTTTETSVAPAVAAVFTDMEWVKVTSTATFTGTPTAARVDFRDVLAGTVRFSVEIPLTPGTPIPAISWPAPAKQTTVNTAWTAQLVFVGGTSPAIGAGDIRITPQTVGNV